MGRGYVTAAIRRTMGYPMRGYVPMGIRQPMSANQNESLENILKKFSHTTTTPSFAEGREIKKMPLEVRFKIIDQKKWITSFNTDDIFNDEEKEQFAEYIFNKPPLNEANAMYRPSQKKIESISDFIPDRVWANFEDTKFNTNDYLKDAVSSAIGGGNYQKDNLLFDEDNINNMMRNIIYRKYPELGISQRVYLTDLKTLQYPTEEVVPRKIENSYLKTMNHVAENFDYDKIAKEEWDNFKKTSKVNKLDGYFEINEFEKKSGITLKEVYFHPEVLFDATPTWISRYDGDRGYEFNGGRG